MATDTHNNEHIMLILYIHNINIIVPMCANAKQVLKNGIDPITHYPTPV